MHPSPWLLLFAAACAVPGSADEPEWAVLTREGIRVVRDEEPGPPLPGSQGTQTFCWDHRAQGFFVTRDGELSWLPLEGGEARSVVEGFRAIRFPATSPAGVVAFAATRMESNTEGWGVWTVNADGSGLRRVSSGYDPSWSPDGSHLYYEDYTPETTLYVDDLETGEIRPVPIGEGGGYTVECSPTGRYLAFSRAGALMLYTVATEALRALTDGSTYDRFASFSPDERFVSFYRQRSGDAEGSRFMVVHYEISTGTQTLLPMGPDPLPAWVPVR